MGKFGDWLFASGGKKGDGVGEYMKQMQNDPMYKFYMSQLGESIEPYKGKLSAGASPLQQAAFSTIPGMAGTPSAQIRQVRADLLSTGEPSFKSGAEYYEKMYETGVEAPELRKWKEETIPFLQHTYGSHSGGSGEFIDQLGDASVDLRTNLAGQKAEISLRGLEREQDELSAAADRSLTAIPISATEETRPLRYALGAGSVERGITQDRLTGDFYKWMMHQPWANPWFSTLGGGGGGGSATNPVYNQAGMGAGLTGLGNLFNG